MSETEKTYTKFQVITAVNDAVNLICNDERIIVGRKRSSLLDLAANGAITLLDDPGATLNEIIRANWKPEIGSEDVVEKVLEWIEP